MTFAMIGVFLLMALVDGRTLVREHSLKQWFVYVTLTVVSSTVLIVYSVTFTKPNILSYLEMWLKPVSRWLAG